MVAGEPRCVHELFEARVDRTPEALAIVSADGELTYAELNRRANQLAHHLVACGARPESLIGLLMERSHHLLVGLLGILKAGAAYVPIDPQWSPAHCELVLADTAVEVVATQGRLRQRVPVRCAVVAIDDDWPVIARQPACNPQIGVAPANLMYCIYTSGSTGSPKGVAVAGASLVNQVTHMTRVLEIWPGDRVLQFTPITIDAALEEIVPAWLGGGAVVMRSEGAPSIDEFGRLLEEQRISVVSLPSSYWHLWVEELVRTRAPRPPALRLVFVGGEEVLTSRLRQWQALPWSAEVRWVADYGPTEATISCATHGAADPCESRVVPIGRAIANVQIHVLDSELRPVANGVTGELHVAGAALARGYWNSAAMTAEAFVPNPFGGPGERMYKTGDLGHALPCGAIQFVGRMDRQVKLHGHRVDPADVEDALRACAGIRDAAVTAREDADGDMRLTAHVVAGDFSEQDIRDELAQWLAPAAIPAAFVVVDRLTAGEEPQPSACEPGATSNTPHDLRAESELVRSVADLFAQSAGRAPGSLDEGFLSCGGDSLRALRLLARIADMTGVEVGYSDFLREPTVRALAARVDEDRGRGTLARARGAHTRPRRRDSARVTRMRASDAQQRLWFLHKLHGGAATYSIPLAYRIRGSLSIDRLDAALTDVVARHEALRTALVEDAGVVWQHVSPPLEIRCRREVAGSFAEALDVARRESERSFELTRSPLMRAVCVELPGDETLFVLNVHHAVFDAWSLGILWRELTVHYGGTGPIADPQLQYGDYVDWQRQWLESAEAERQRAFWRTRLAGDLPVLRLHGAAGAGRLARCPQGAIESLSLDAATGRAARELARAHETTAFVILLAAFFATLHRHTLQDEIVVGVPAACRSTPEIDGVIGYFANTVAIRMSVPPRMTFATLVDETAAALAEAMANQHLPFNQVVDSIAAPRQAETNPAFQAMFVMQSMSGDEAPRLEGVEIEEVAVHSGTAKVDVSCMVRSTGDGYEGELEYACDVLDPGSAAGWVDTFVQLLRAATQCPRARLGELRMLAEPHGAALVAEAGVLAEAPQEPQLVHAVFEARAGSDPDAVAIESEGAAITYGDLDARASRLARALVEAGATAERPIGVHIDRSIDMVVALLAILKTGAAFVPLDPSLPVERIHAIVADADLQLIVTQAQHADALAAAAPPLIVERRDVAAEAAPAPRAHVSVDAIACIYYTSGSTGTPKGVMLSHRCVMGRLDWLRRRYPLTIGDRVLHKTPLAFDVALWEVFGPLRAGATILMADAGSEADVPHIARLLAADRTVFAHFVPSMLDAFLSYAPRCAYPDLRWVQLSGEAVPAALLERFREHFDAELHSMYGQTETSEVAAWEGREWRGAGGVPIGRQIGIYRLLVLDDALAPVPPGVPGEICVAGCGGLAHGYHARPELTAERFVPNPYPREPGERLYRTGDWASRGRDGVIHFLGRGDGQVKVRGCRVETGDVEAALQRHAAVRVSAVVARPDASGHMELVAYVVGDEATTAELSAHVGRLLPRYMIPATFVRLVGLPLTTSGKVDRHSLPAPRPCDRDSRAAATSPRNPLESDLVQTWKEVLGLTDVGIADNYFAVGGNSLTCMQILHRVSTTFGVEVSVRSFFEAPTVEGLAGAVEDALVAMVVTLTDDEVDRRLAVLTAGAPRV